MLKQRKNRGVTLIEVLISATLLTIAVLGSVQYVKLSHWQAKEGVRSQFAWNNMAMRMALALDLEYDALQDSLFEISTPFILEGMQGYRSTIITEIDDPFDGLAPVDTTLPDYLKVTISFAWNSPDNVTDSLSSSFSAERYWNY